MIRFALASPSNLVRAGLAAGLGAQDDCAVVLSAATLAELVEAGYGGAEIVVIDAGAEADHELDPVAPAGPRFILLAAADLRDLRQALAAHVGQTVPLAVLRGGAPLQLQASVGEWPGERRCH